MEGAVRYNGISVPSATVVPNSLKRKSGDVMVSAAPLALEEEERRYKFAKNLDDDVAPLKQRARRILHLNLPCH